MNDAADNEVANLDNALENDSIDPRSDIPILWFEECFAAARAHRGALHGRAEEVDLIHQVYERAIRNASTKNASQLVLISGVTGIGKTPSHDPFAVKLRMSTGVTSFAENLINCNDPSRIRLLWKQ
jgi:hypothetical protein